MKWKILTIAACICIAEGASAQRYEYVQQGEFGFTAGRPIILVTLTHVLH